MAWSSCALFNRSIKEGKGLSAVAVGGFANRPQTVSNRDLRHAAGLGHALQTVGF
jgi:hypothetical protein